MTRCTRHPENEISGTCRVCHSEYCPDCFGSSLGICPGCAYKVLIILLIVMIVASYTVWFGLF